ncbi:MAG: 3-deoxy-7-phosphoheptulonate synthase [Gammaproteobacteria bacterium]|jgi:3-deoxy-7-phosphoheptulonate synthase|nr:3-deoxy-7-phosphoheptulonate synthase [Gammaproteobacteria bacterium]
MSNDITENINTGDLRIARTHPLISPAVLAEEVPQSANSKSIVGKARNEIADILHKRDPRILVIVGPCSVHDPIAVLEYAKKLQLLAQELAERALLVMRVYFEKPRTTVGWKGYINDPHLDGSYRVNEGLRAARSLLADITDIGLPCASEFLDTTLGQYYAELVSWGAIGARTVESQIHRQLASGLSMPVGFKNRTDGDLQVAVDGMVAAASSHLFPSLTMEGTPALLETSGNTDTHLVLRGGREPNYDDNSINAASKLLDEKNLETGIVVDCSHANSHKDHEQQKVVAASVVKRRAKGDKRVVGVMIESHLVAGRQAQSEQMTYGQSITDACIDLPATADLMRVLADA